MQNVKTLLAKINSISGGFKRLRFNFKNISGEVFEIFRMQHEKNIDGLLSFWKNKDQEEFFELAHPVSSIKTKAFYSYQANMFNYVFMIDDDGGSFWILVQSTSCIEAVITDDVIYTSTNNDTYINLKQLSNLNVDDLKINPKPYGYLLSQSRPYHYFYDHLKVFLHLNTSKSVEARDSYFIPSSCDAKQEIDQVFLFPATYANYDFSQKSNPYLRTLNVAMEDLVYKESMVSFKEKITSVTQDVDFIIWLGITGQKRSWLQQVEGYISIIKHLNKEFPKIKVYIDGWTAIDGKTTNNADDEEIFNRIQQGLKNESGIKLISLVGQDYRAKICHCSTVDVFIANSGTGSTVPLRFNKKPGVLHRNTRLFTYNDIYPDTVMCTDSKLIVDVNLGDEKLAQFFSYHTPWQHIFNLTVEIINKIKGVSIQALEVPTMEQVKQEYEAREKNKALDLEVFENLNTVITSKHGSADILRDVALAFEETGDVSMALTIMKKALELRPSGPVIKRKVTKYLEQLKTE
jgi:hypothetical protein